MADPVFPCSSYTPILRFIDINDPTGTEVWPLAAIVNNYDSPNYMVFEWYNPSNKNQWRFQSISNIQYDVNNNPISANVVWQPYPFNTP